MRRERMHSDHGWLERVQIFLLNRLDPAKASVLAFSTRCKYIPVRLVSASCLQQLKMQTPKSIVTSTCKLKNGS